MSFSNFFDGQELPYWKSPFPSPMMDYCSTVMPEDNSNALRHVEYMGNNNGTYRSALERVLSYFITKVVVGDEDTSDDERDRWDKVLNQDFNVNGCLHDVGLDLCVYGNSFTSIWAPFRRFAQCDNCSFRTTLRRVAEHPGMRATWANGKVKAKCTECHSTGTWQFRDFRTSEQQRIHLQRWSPHQIDIIHDPYSTESAYVWKIPEVYRRRIREGFQRENGLFILERCHQKVIDAVMHNTNLLFDPGFIYHIKEPALAGHQTGGWGMSRIMPNYRQAWYVQLMHRHNEAIALDSVLPFRVITPSSSPGANAEAHDPLLAMGMGNLMGHLHRMLRLHRIFPGTWHTLPYPVQMQNLGGDAKQLAPFELIDQSVSLLLNNIGVPVELYKGSLQLQTAFVAVRLFEAIWSHLVNGLNAVLRNIVKQIAEIMNWEEVPVSLAKVTILDDIQNQLARLQLMGTQNISQTTGLETFGLKFKTEQRRILDEQRFIQEQQAKVQKEMDEAAAMESLGQSPGPQMAPGVPMAPPGAPGAAAPPPGSGGAQAAPAGQAGAAAQGMAMAMPETPNQHTTPMDMLNEAQATAQQMMLMPESQRRSALSKLKAQKPALHGIVSEAIDNIRYQARMAGGQQMMAAQGMAA